MKRNRLYSRQFQAASLSAACCVALCLPPASRADNYTSTQVVPINNSWTGNYWQDNGTGALTGPPTQANTYELISNGATLIGNCTTTRDPAVNGSTQVFPGDSLQLDLNTKLLMKGPGTTLSFPGPGAGAPGLILNGGMLQTGDDGPFWIAGIINVVAQSYLSPGASGVLTPLRSMNLSGQLIGSANLVLLSATNNYPQEISGNNNSFSGQWIIQNGWLLGSGNQSLGTNTITVDPNWPIPSAIGTPYLSGPGPALLDVSYPLNSAGTLILTNGGRFALHQNVCFAGVLINGTPLSAGTHYYADLLAAYPANFTAGGWGTLTVQPYGVPPVAAPPTPIMETWFSTDVGAPNFKGSVITNADGTLDMLGGGSDIWGTAAQFHYYYAWAYGPQWDISAQVKAFTGPDTWSKVELMVAQSVATAGPANNDPFITVMDTQPNWVIPPDGTATGQNIAGVDQFRTTRGGSADWLQVGANPRPNYPDQWFRINRNGSVFTLYYGGDGYTWNQYMQIDTSKTTIVGAAGTKFGTAWPNLVTVGIAVTSHNNTWTNAGVVGGADATIANLQGTFPPATAPTFVTASQPIQSGVTNSYGCEASLSFVATNNAFPNPNLVGISYQWYKNGTAIAGATATVHTWLLDTTDNGAQYSCSATLAAPFNAITTNSASAMVGVVPGVYYTNGLKLEMFTISVGSALSAVEAGNLPVANWQSVIANLDQPGGFGNYYCTRVSGWFIPPTTDSYVFYDASDDGSDLFVSTDATMGNKQLVAQETGWNNLDQWVTGGGGGGNNYAQQCSDTFRTNSTGTAYYPTGIPLIAGQPYYIEQDHYQGTGGDCFCATYQTYNQVLAGSPTNGMHTLFAATNGNLMFITRPVTTLTWVTQPTNTVATLGLPTTLYAKATSDSELNLSYQWYRANAPIAGATATSYSLASPAIADNGVQFYVVATTAENELSITSSPAATLNVAAPVLEKGWAKVEYFYSPNPGLAAFSRSVTNATSGNITNYLVTTNTTTPNYTIFEPIFEGNSKAAAPVTYTSRLSGYFYPPATDYYTFFANSDDACSLFVSTDANASNAVLVAQETAYSSSWTWTSQTGAGVISQKRSDQWTNAVGFAPYVNGILMTAGQPYYLALMHVDTGGGNNCEATFKRMNSQSVNLSYSGVPDTDPATGTYSAMTGSLIASYVPRCFSMAFTTQPGTVTVPLGGVATLSVVGATDSKSAVGDETDPEYQWTNNFVFYQWLKNGVAIAGANASSYSFGPVSPLDSALQFTCQIRALGFVNNSLVDVWSNSAPAALTVTSPSGTPVYEPGFVLHEYFALNPGRAPIESGAISTPTWMMAEPAFEADIAGTEVADYFTDELVGFFTPPSSGNYVFFLNGDDTADLYLSTDTSASSRRLIAQQTGAAGGVLHWGTGGTLTQVRSDTFVDATTGLAPYANGIALLAGQKYFMQCVHAQNAGATYSCVTAMMTSDPTYPAAPATGVLSTLRGTRVGAYVPRCAYVAFTAQPQSVRVTNYTSAVFTAAGTTDSQVAMGNEGDWRTQTNNFLLFQWYKNGQPIAGGTTPTLTISPVLPSDDNSVVTCAIRALGYASASGSTLWSNSLPAVLNVTVSGPPYLLYSGIYTNYADANFPAFGYVPAIYVDLAFSGPMNPVALANPQNYVFSPGSGITSADIMGITVNSNGYRNVELALDASPNLPFTVQILGASALGGGPALAGPNVTNVKTVSLTCVDIGGPAATTLSGWDPSVPTTMYADGAGGYTVQCEGSDIWNGADGCNYLYELKGGNFDVVVRQIDIAHIDNWTKGGLMIRETLDASSRDWSVLNTPVTSDGIQALDASGFGANGVYCYSRILYGGASASWITNASPVPAYPNAWVRLSLQRVPSADQTTTNNIVTAYSSTNGLNWTVLAQTDITTNTDGSFNPPLPDPVYVGICSTAHHNDAISGIAGQYVATEDYADYNSSYVYTAPPPSQPILTWTKTDATHMVISWTPAGGTLLASPALAGPTKDWQPVGTANPSAPILITGTPQYFRVKAN